MNDLSELLNAIKSEINMVVERHLLPHFEKMKCNNENMKLIETVLHQMPAFQQLQKENAELKERLNQPEVTPIETNTVPATSDDIPSANVSENIIKLDIVETASPNEISESEIYQNANVSEKLTNKQIEEVEEVEETEEDGVEGAEPTEEEASEVEEVEETEEEVEDADETEEEDGGEGAEPLDEEEASEAEEEEEEVEEEEEEVEEEEEEVEEEEEEEEDGVEGAEPLEEEEASEAEDEVEEEEEEDGVEDGVEGAEPLEEEEDGVEGAEPLAEPLEEEVSLVEIKGHGQFYTNNAVNGEIYKVDADEEVGDHIGNFVNGIPLFF
jgi:hypothetical protein